MPYKFYVSLAYEKKFKKLPRNIQILAAKIIDEFMEDPFNKKFDLHKLKGNMHDRWSFSINYRYRVVISIEGEAIKFQAIGNHSVYSDR